MIKSAELRSTVEVYRLLGAVTPPGFEQVVRWRSEQEQHIEPDKRMNAEALQRFIDHYEIDALAVGLCATSAWSTYRVGDRSPGGVGRKARRGLCELAVQFVFIKQG